MENAQDFVAQSRRQLIRIIAIVLLVAGVSFTGLLLVLIALLPNNASLPIYATILSGFVLGSAATLYLLPRTQTTLAMLPLLLALIACVIASTLVFRETIHLALPFLGVVLLLLSFGGRRIEFLLIGIGAVVAAVVLAATAPRPLLGPAELSLGPTLPLVNMVSVGSLLLVIWLIAMRLITISDQAVHLADRRAKEAEQARAESERRAVELAEQNETQQRLIDLVTTLETPMVNLAEGVALMPIIGHVDTRRSQDLTTRLLEMVHYSKIRLVIIDVSGVAILDTGVVQRLLQTVRAVQLLGSGVTICGVQAEMATTLVQLGIGLEGLAVVRTPQEALERELRLTVPV